MDTTDDLTAKIKKLPREDMQFVCFDLLHRIEALQTRIKALEPEEETEEAIIQEELSARV